MGITVLTDLPVGQKLYDHPTFIGLTYRVNETIVGQQEDMFKLSVMIDYVSMGEGPLSGLGGCEAYTFIKTKESTEKNEEYPDIELILIGGNMGTDFGLIHRKIFRITDEIYDAVWKPLEDKPAFMILPLLLHPKSFGYLELQSSSPFDYPKLHGNYFTDPDGHDIKTLVAAIREAQRIVNNPSMRRYDAKLHSVPIPGCGQHRFDSDEYWECALRHTSPTLYHQIGTCKMGPNHDPEAVVDNKLRVYGVKNLRVVDSSIIPLPLSGHTNVPTIMIGEKASDLIKDKWLKVLDEGGLTNYILNFN